MGTIEDIKKIKFLVERKFPGSNAPPPPPTIHKPRNPTNQEFYEERIKQKNRYKDELNALPREEMDALYQQEWQVLIAERKQKEDNRFFNRPSADADSSWKHAALVTTEEATALAFNKDPEIVNWKSVRPYVNVSPFAEDYKRLRNLVIRAVAARILPCNVTPKAFAIWLQSIEHDMPSWMTDMVNSQSVVSPGDAQADSSVNESDTGQPNDKPEEIPSISTTKMLWIKKARELGKIFKRDHPKWGQRELADNVREEMVKRKITGRGGKVPCAGTIKKEALKGIVS